MIRIFEFDIITFVFSVAGVLLVIIKSWKVPNQFIKVTLLSLFLLYSAFSGLLFTEWSGFSTEFEPLEDLTGTILPITWLIIFYMLLQQVRTSNLKDSEERLRKSEANLREAQHIAKMGHYTFDVKTTSWNCSVELDNIFGIDNTYKKDIEGWLKIVHPDNRKDMKNYLLDNVINNHEKFDKQYRIINVRTGLEKWMHGVGNLKFDEHNNPVEMFGIIQDITEQKRAEQLIFENERRMDLILKGADLGAWDWNIVTGEVFFNKRWAEMLGYKLKEIEPSLSSWENLVHPDDMPIVIKVLSEHLEGKTEFYETEHRMRTIDGKWKWILDRGKVTERDINGKPLRATGTHLDITERREMEDQIKQKNEEYQVINEELTESLNRIQMINTELEKAKVKVEESDRLKTAFLANLSHEIRTPMNGILGFADLLKKEKLTPKAQKRYIEIIEQSGLRMLNLIEDLVDISMIESNQVEIRNELTNLNQLMDKVYHFFKPQAQHKELEFEVRKGLLPEECNIMIDTVKLEQILTNLVNNAIKFTADGKVEMGYKLIKDTLHFWVTDTGIGIAEEMHKLIFERFRQVNKTYLSGIEGTGLGLAISKAFIELMGGKIRVDSDTGKGATFKFTLPYSKVELKHSSGAVKEQPVVKTALTILIAEDDEISYMFLEELLAENNATILHAKNGQQAIELFQQNPEVRLILMDIKMPVMNGLDATRRIRELDGNVPILAQTAYASQNDKQQVLDAGCNGYITKPIDQNELLTAINSILESN
ncbi:MAG: PAS domain-containing protein [Bacteroidales bacterium]|nr:PAS domain-containing protein [Bacteroidales bacterium]